MQPRTLVVALVVAAVGLAAAGGLAAADASAAQDDTVTIELQVSNTEGQSVGDADVTVEWEGGSTEASTRSNGRVLVDVPDGADLEISLEHSDYVRNVPVEVDGARADQVVDITMYRPATAEVEVVDTEGQAVEGARVRLRRHGQSTYADQGETGSDGVWTSGEVEEGTYEVRVFEPGYYRASQDVDLSGTTQETIEIEEGDVTVDLLIRDPTEGGPGPLAADVTIRQDGERVLTATTNDAGRRAITLDVNTRYQVEVAREGYRTAQTAFTTGEERQELAINISRQASVSIEVGNDQVVVGENLRVEVTDEYDRPVEGATVTLDGEEAGETDSEGVARVEIPTEGEVAVSASYDGMETETVTVTGVSSTTSGDEPEADGNESDDGGDDGTPGFGVAAAVIGLLAATAIAVRRR